MESGDLDELYRIMNNWARPHSGMSKEDLAALYAKQLGLANYKVRNPTHEELRRYYLGENRATQRGTWEPAYDAVPQRYPSFPEQFNSPMKSIYDMLQQQLGPMKKGVETGGLRGLNDPRYPQKFDM